MDTLGTGLSCGDTKVEDITFRILQVLTHKFGDTVGTEI
jgi:hypothetical protein